MSLKQDIQKLISEGRLDTALDKLYKYLEKNAPESEEFTNFSAIKGNYAKAKTDANIGLLSNAEFARETARANKAILDTLKVIEEIEAPNSTNNPGDSSENPPSANEPVVFISYNHKDSETAHKLRKKLGDEGIKVIIDKETMKAGEDIKEFIQRSIREATITLSLVSKNSLLSAWVAMESIGTFSGEAIAGKRFIACYIDDDFFNRGYIDEALDVIEEEVNQINETIQKRLKRNRNIRDLQNELSRYKDLEHNIDETVRRLRESLCIDVSGNKLESNFPKLLESIKQ